MLPLGLSWAPCRGQGTSLSPSPEPRPSGHLETLSNPHLEPGFWEAVFKAVLLAGSSWRPSWDGSGLSPSLSRWRLERGHSYAHHLQPHSGRCLWGAHWPPAPKSPVTGTKVARLAPDQKCSGMVTRPGSRGPQAALVGTREWSMWCQPPSGASMHSTVLGEMV